MMGNSGRGKREDGTHLVTDGGVEKREEALKRGKDALRRMDEVEATRYLHSKAGEYGSIIRVWPAERKPGLLTVTQKRLARAITEHDGDDYQLTVSETPDSEEYILVSLTYDQSKTQ
jgi:hypothetical protein